MHASPFSRRWSIKDILLSIVTLESQWTGQPLLPNSLSAYSHPTVVSACLRPPHNLWITAHGGVDANPTIAFHHHHRCCSASGALTVPFRLLLLPSASVVCFGLPVVVCLLLPVVGTGESDTVARALHCPACAKNCVVCRKSHTKGRLVHARRPSSNKKGERALLPHDF